MTTFIFGHKNPDTDSVCSSIALSYLKNSLGGKTEPRVLGNINNETKFVLETFNIPTPSYLNDVRVRIKDINYDDEAFINEKKSINTSFKLMQNQNITAIPLIDDEHKLSGYVTLKELAKYLINGSREVVDTTLDNILETLDAEILTKSTDEVQGVIKLAGLKTKTIQEKYEFNSSDIIITGDRPQVLEYAINSKVQLIVLSHSVKLDSELIKKAEENKVTIITSPLDSFGISTKITLSNYVKNININKSPVTVNSEDYFTDFKTMTHKVNHTNYPVINNKGECLGLIRLTGPNDYEKQQVILVDHNNLAQSVDGIEEASIEEIIDHHNLGAIGTSVPINFRSKPVGCTSTMVYNMFVEENVEVPKNIAGIMLSAILSDTLLLTGPTTTEEDRATAIKLASIADVNIDTYGLEMMKAASSIEGLTVQELIKGDLKTFNVADKTLGIGQVMTLDIDKINDMMDEFVDNLNEMANTNYSMVVIFITDIIKNGSYVIYNDASASIIADSFGIENIHQGVFIPKVVSRKKQMLPNIMAVLES